MREAHEAAGQFRLGKASCVIARRATLHEKSHPSSYPFKVMGLTGISAASPQVFQHFLLITPNYRPRRRSASTVHQFLQKKIGCPIGDFIKMRCCPTLGGSPPNTADHTITYITSHAAGIARGEKALRAAPFMPSCLSLNDRTPMAARPTIDHLPAPHPIVPAALAAPWAGGSR
jgi:hypothetical protein